MGKEMVTNTETRIPLPMIVAKKELSIKYGEFLKKFELYLEEAQYNMELALVVRCEDGQEFVGISSHKKGASFKAAYQDLVEVIESAYCKTLPRMDRIMREMYE